MCVCIYLTEPYLLQILGSTVKKPLFGIKSYCVTSYCRHGSCARTCHHAVLLLLLSANVCGTNYRTAWSQTKEEQNSATVMAERDCRATEAMFAGGRRMRPSMTEVAKKFQKIRRGSIYEKTMQIRIKCREGG